MSIKVSGKNMEVGESLTHFVEEEVRAIIAKHMGDALEASAIFTKDHHLFKVDISVHMSRNFVAHCHGEDADAYRAVSQAIEKLTAKVKRHRERLRHLKRQRDEADFSPVQQYVLKPFDESHAIEDTPLVIAETTGEMTRLTVSEAVVKMDLIESPVLLFRNAANNEINVVYRRADGHIGWLDPSRAQA